jgi:hypothetical protein
VVDIFGDVGKSHKRDANLQAFVSAAIIEELPQTATDAFPMFGMYAVSVYALLHEPIHVQNKFEKPHFNLGNFTIINVKKCTSTSINYTHHHTKTCSKKLL